MFLAFSFCLSVLDCPLGALLASPFGHNTVIITSQIFDDFHTVFCAFFDSRITYAMFKGEKIVVPKMEVSSIFFSNIGEKERERQRETERKKKKTIERNKEIPDYIRENSEREIVETDYRISKQ